MGLLKECICCKSLLKGDNKAGNKDGVTCGINAGEAQKVRGKSRKKGLLKSLVWQLYSSILARAKRKRNLCYVPLIKV